MVTIELFRLKRLSGMVDLAKAQVYKCLAYELTYDINHNKTRHKYEKLNISNSMTKNTVRLNRPVILKSKRKHK